MTTAFATALSGHYGVALAISVAGVLVGAVHAESVPTKGLTDSRIRSAAYADDQVYKLHGYVGYAIDLQFESGETFIGLGAGDVAGLSFVAQTNHLFLKPKAANVKTDLTILTSRRSYHFDYYASRMAPDVEATDVIYVLRFVYIPVTGSAAERVDAQLASAPQSRPRNEDYWYCGQSELKPSAAWDDGVHTRLRFNTHADLPAIFVRNEDGTESLINFSVEAGDIVIHRIAHQFVVRRGKLRGCIVNRHFGGGERLQSGTVSPAVQRTTLGAQP